MTDLQPPLAMLAELTHRCPMQCPYCSNPLQLEAARDELDTATWQRVIDEAADLGILQIHFPAVNPPPGATWTSLSPTRMPRVCTPISSRPACRSTGNALRTW